MKKIALSLAGLLAAAAFAPNASALPVFARQTGMACDACHFQEFPMLNQFGRAFKSSGFTLIGTQARVEGEKTSIPEEVNASLLTTLGYATQNTHNQAPGQQANGSGNGWFVPGSGSGEFSLFVGGRISDFAGAISELGFTGAGGAGALNGGKIAMLPEFAGGHAGAVFFTTGDKGGSYGYETLNTGANGVHTMFFVAGDLNGSIMNTLSAQQYIGTGVAATGGSLVYAHDMGFVNLTKYNMLAPDGTTAGNMNASLGSTYGRAAVTLDIAGWDTAVGVQSWTGSSYSYGNGTFINGTYNTRARAVDGQMQGSIAGMPTGFYVSYADAPSVTGGSYNGNIFNAGTVSKTSLNIGAQISIIPHEIAVGAAMRRAHDGAQDVYGNALTDNAFLADAIYTLRQNMLVEVVYTKQSGSAWNVDNGVNTNGGDKQISCSLAIMY